MSSIGFHEPVDELSTETRDLQRAMLFGWLRRHDQKYSRQLKTCLFSEKPITDH